MTPSYRQAYRFLVVAALAFWMGGFTFYALIVVPVGNQLLGGIEQGMVTQQVTNWMNRLGILSLLLIFADARQDRWRLIAWGVMAVALAALFAMHLPMDELIDRSQPAILHEAIFKRWHQAYLVVVTIQWSAALVYLGRFASLSNV